MDFSYLLLFVAFDACCMYLIVFIHSMWQPSSRILFQPGVFFQSKERRNKGAGRSRLLTKTHGFETKDEILGTSFFLMRQSTNDFLVSLYFSHF